MIGVTRIDRRARLWGARFPERLKSALLGCTIVRLLGWISGGRMWGGRLEDTRFPIIWASLGAIWLAFRGLPILLRAAWFPVLLFVLVWVASAYLRATGAFDTGDFLPGLLDGVLSIAPVFLLVPAMTAWIRMTVLGPPSDGAYPVWRFGSEEWRFFGFFVLITIAAMVLFAGPILLGVLIGVRSIILWSVFGAISVVVAIYIVGRLLPVLGAAALGVEMMVSHAWQDTEEDGWRIAVAHGITIAVLFAILVGFYLTLFGVGLEHAYTAVVDGGGAAGLAATERVVSLLILVGLLDAIGNVFFYLVLAVFMGRAYAALATDPEDCVAPAFD
jgi:hypothetical protein